MGPGMRDEIKSGPFSLKILRKRKCFKRHKQIDNTLYTITYQYLIHQKQWVEDGR
ncbi:hypothetical protein IB64_004505 [Bacteroides fragilis]|nr:hypothetical protein IB64_004505 [Bacteroides fragilis]